MIHRYNSFNKMEACSPFCPLECTSEKFDKTIQSFYSPTAINFFNINIYYEAMLYYKNTQQPSVTLIGLISSFGGTFGLFLGLSLMSFIEFFFFLIELVVLFIRHIFC